MHSQIVENLCIAPEIPEMYNWKQANEKLFSFTSFPTVTLP